MNFIGIDWGSTNFRTYLIKNDCCIEQINLPNGITAIKKTQDFEPFLYDVLAPWRQWIESEHVPVLLTGMVGSDQGWIDSGYQLLPLTLTQIAKGCIKLPSRLKTDVWLHPGLAQSQPANVMRGEEVQLLGALQQCHADVYVFPGTHSKWVIPTQQAGSELIDHFSTVITGELFHILMQYSLIGKGCEISTELDEQLFKVNFQRGFHSHSIIEALFTLRADRVLHHKPAEQTAERLSALLIGHELQTQLAHFTHKQRQSLSVAIVAASPLAKRYQFAFSVLSINAVCLNPEKTIIDGFRGILHGL